MVSVIIYRNNNARPQMGLSVFLKISQDTQAMLHLLVLSNTCVCTKVAHMKWYYYCTMDFVGLCYVADEMEFAGMCKNMMFSNWVPNLGVWVLLGVKPYTSISHQLNFMSFCICLCYRGKLIVWIKLNSEFSFSQF